MQTISKIEQVWLFGSYARGEHKNSSDIDVLYISETECEEPVQKLMSGTEIPRDRVDFSHYTREGISTLAAKGSLFTWHLREEGQPLYQENTWLRELLDVMPKYRSHIEDLSVLVQLVKEVDKSLLHSGSTAIFDAGVLSTAIRNTGIILTNYIGVSDYSPYAPLKLSYLEPCLSLPITSTEYMRLLNCRHASERGNSVVDFHLDIHGLRGNVQKIRRWQNQCAKYINSQGVEYVH